MAPQVSAQDYAVVTVSRHVLTNESVISLAKAGFDELFIVERIRTSRTKFDASVEGMVTLKEAGVSEELIGVIAVQDRRNYLQARRSYSVPLESEQRAGTARVMVEKHWWGFRWVRVLP